MWYEIIPAGALIYACLMIPEFVPSWMNYFVLGTPCRRAMYHNLNIHDILRDRRLTGDEYKFLTLEDLPDEDQVPSSSKTGSTYAGSSSQQTC